MAGPDQPNALVKALEQARAASAVAAGGEPATPVDLPELVTFLGFFGETITQLGVNAPNGAEWRLFYLDWRLHEWLLVEERAIVRYATIKDDHVPGGIWDVIWVKADARVGKGTGSQSAQSRFLSGGFTRAGDLDASPTGGTMGAATGVFCEARSPSCCYTPRSR